MTAIKQVQLSIKNYNYKAGPYDMPDYKRNVQMLIISAPQNCAVTFNSAMLKTKG